MLAGRHRIMATAGAIGLAATIALAGCGSSGDNSTTSSDAAGDVSAQRADAPAAGPNEEAGSAAKGGTGADTAAKAPDLSVDQRSIIYTGSITVRVEDVNIAAARASGIATAAGGFVGGDKRTSGSGSSDASLELRIPAAKFSAVVEQLAGLGDEEQRGINTEDVTEQTIDLDARIATQTARVDSGRRLLAQAKSLTDLVMLEREVATRESDLASLQAKKRRLADLTALSTITVVFLDPQAAAPNTDDDGAPGFLSGLENGWKGLLASLGVLLTVVGWLLPWVIAIGVPAWAVLLLYRRYRRNQSVAATTPALSAAGAGAPPPAESPADHGEP